MGEPQREFFKIIPESTFPQIKINGIAYFETDSIRSP